MQTTFTVLVTLDHDAGQGHSPSRIAEIVQCALEEGTSCSGGFASATVDAFKGDLLPGMHGPNGTSAAKKLHASMRA